MAKETALFQQKIASQEASPDKFRRYACISQEMQFRVLLKEEQMKREPEKKNCDLALGDVAYWDNFGIFQQHRGQLGVFVRFLEEIFGDKESSYFCESPSQFRRLNFFSGDLLALGNKIMQLKRQGETEFMEEVLRALRISKYLLPGEEPIDKETTPVTLLMLDPKKTIFLLRAMMPYGFFDELSVFVNPQQISRQWVERIRPSIPKIFDLFPSLKKYVRFWTEAATPREKELDRSRAADCIRSAYLVDVVTNFWPHLGELAIRKHFIDSRQFVGDACGFDRNDSVFELDWKENQERHFKTSEFGSSFLYAVKGERTEVLSRFPRNLQKRIASWQLRVPKDIGYQYIGLHEADEHLFWKKRWPIFASRGEKGVSHDLGAILMPCRYSVLSGKYLTFGYERPQKPFRLLFEIEKRR